MKAPPSLPPPLAVRFLSEAWAQEALRRVETDPRVRDGLHGLDVGLLAIVLHAPEDIYGFLYVAFDAGGLRDFRAGRDYHEVTRDIPAPTFAVSGDYAVFAAVQRGEMSERKAILSGKLHLTGSTWKALRYVRALEALGRVLRDIPCET